MPGKPELRIRTLASLREIPAADWNGLFDTAYPFIQHDFLNALEVHGCVGGHRGWEPCHRLLEDAAGRPVAAMPMYRKQHSWGEFVFDFSWAQASQSLGHPYYPKLVVAIPYTPVSGPRVGARDEPARQALLASLDAELAANRAASSVHMLFPDNTPAHSGIGWLERNDIQFHWFNRGYADFGAFLAGLTHDRRKKILRERRRCSEAGLKFEVRRGDQLRESEWAAVHAMYANTYDERGQLPYLSLDFFLDYGQRAGTPVRLILALSDGVPVAVAITLAAGGVLYGRHWGCTEQHHSLHFETCYYQGIELCLREGYMHFDAGTQGAHKLARGFEPVLTRSLHRLAEPRLHQAVARFLEQERAAVRGYREDLALRVPFRAPDIA